MRLLITALLPLAVMAAGFETGVVAQSDGAAFHRNTIPQVARLGNGNLMTVMGVYAKATPSTTRIATAASSDGGRTWSNATSAVRRKGKGARGRRSEYARRRQLLCSSIGLVFTIPTRSKKPGRGL